MSRRTKVSLGEIGRTGLTRFGGIISEEWLPELSGSRGATTYKKMSSNDAIIGGMLFAIEMLGKGVSWFSVPGGQREIDQEAARFLESCLFDMSVSWPMTLTEILSMIRFGWSWMEIVYKIRRGPRQTNSSFKSKYNDGLIGWHKWAPRAQESLLLWDYDEEKDSLLAMIQMGPPDYVEHRIPIEKSLLFRTTSAKGNPEGLSLLRNCYRSWYIKTAIEDIEGIGIERDLAGFPVLYAPGSVVDPDPNDASAVQAHNEYETIVTSLRRDELEGLLLPSVTDDKGNRQYELKLLASSGMRQFNTSQIITRYDTRIALTLMADFLMLGQQKSGSYALSETKARLFTQALTSILDNITETINDFAVPRLFELNPKFDDAALPELAHGKVESINLDQLGTFIQRLTGSGAKIFPDDTLENHLRAQADLPLKPAIQTQSNESSSEKQEAKA